MARYRWKRLDFNPTCPSGGTWYSCAAGSRFVGCCASDPCSNGCSQGNIRSVSFDAAYYGKFPDASCGSGSDFYTCASGSKTFWGCCKSNPCNQGQQCPSGDLVPAFIDRPEQSSAYSPTGGPSSTKISSTPASTSHSSTTTTSDSSSTTSSVSSSTTGSSAASHSATVTVIAASSGQSKGDSHIAAIAGGAAGGGVGIAVILGLLIYFILHARKSRNQHKDSLDRRQSDLTMRASEKPDMGGSPTVPVPPPYVSPDPNAYPYDPNSFTYQQHAARQYELPTTPSSPRSMWRVHHPHRLSELSGETARRSEVESPMQPSPHAYNAPQSPRNTGEESPNWARHPWEGQQAQGTTVDGNGDRIYEGGYHQVWGGYQGR